MKRWKIDALSDVEKIEYDESRALVHARILGKLAQFKKKGYISSDVFEQLHQTHLEAFSKWCNQRASDTAESVNTGTYVADRVLRMHAIGIEKLFLKELYTYDEINETVYKRLLAKLGLQMQSLEFGSLPTNTSDEHDKLDIFERLANMMRKYSSLNKEKAVQNQYLYYRAQMILSRKVIKEFSELFNLDCETVTLSKSHAHIFDEQALGRIMDVYLSFRENSTKKMLEVEATHPSVIQKLSLELAHRGLVKIEEKIIDDLLEKEIISPKIALVLSNEKS
jgi:hypothetical protein